ncbi:magnesium transporter [Zhouia sp. PK063]|uniref:magnesium transporter n=1 Tax=Zhouia sp. PK063 TaxID=3373602 RepID=UPI0037BB0B8B
MKLIHQHPSDIAEHIIGLSETQKNIAFLTLPGELQAQVFTYLSIDEQEAILKSLGNKNTAQLLNNMSPDDRTKLLSEFPDNLIKSSINLLDEKERVIALELLGYNEDSIARIMTPNYIQTHPEWTVKRTLSHIKIHGKKAETLNFVYVVDKDNKLIDDLKIGQLLLADEDAPISSLMDNNFVAITSTTKKEQAIQLFERYDRAALPIITEKGVLVGIVTFDDMLDEVEKRDTEDIQKFGGIDALELPYTQTSLLEMVKKRAGWLIILFISEMLTASAMGYFDEEISKAVVLALFVPLIISSGGNSGSQAATLIIRAMALNEISLKKWWYVMRREIISGLLLGLILGVIGFIRIMIWQKTGLFDYGQYWFWVALSVSFSLVCIVLWGTLSGSMIPFLLKKLGLDPATASAPFVATLVDVTGLIIYFTVAAMFLTGKLL